MLTPRILNLGNDNAIPCVFNIVPNSNTFSLKSPRYLLEWRDILSMQLLGCLDLNLLREVRKVHNRQFELVFDDNVYKLRCADSDEMQNYVSGLRFLMSRC